jgi:2,3-bisphosphoglycerate-independent phosphoglycerate mutase
MKYIILLGDGMADYPLGRFGRRTPLEVARTPHMDRMAREGTVGLINTIPAGFPPGSDVANLTVLGYDPETYYTGRGPLEAASMGIHLSKDDVAFRCNLVTLSGNENPLMEDYSAGHITSAESRDIVAALEEKLGSEDWSFHPGVGYRHLLLWRGGPETAETTPPHDILGQGIGRHLPRGSGAEDIAALMMRSRDVLKGHPVNARRIAEGKRPANSIWLWGQGKAPRMKPLTEKYKISGAIISAVDLLRGIGVYAGLEAVRVPGATGYIDTDYLGKARKALEILKDRDFVFVHVEAPDEMGHEGNAEGKIKAIEEFDEKVVGTVMNGLQGEVSYRLMVLSDHPTPVSRKTHVNDPSPFAVLSSDGDNLRNGDSFSEKVAQKTGILVLPGFMLMEHFLGDWRGFIGKEGR